MSDYTIRESQVRAAKDALSSQPQPLTAAEVARRLGQSGFTDDLAAAIASVALSVISTGHAGAVKVTLAITKATQEEGESPRIVVNETITPVLPKSKPKGALFFVDEDGGLHRRNPNQAELDVAVRKVPDQDGGAARSVDQGETRRRVE